MLVETIVQKITNKNKKQTKNVKKLYLAFDRYTTGDCAQNIIIGPTYQL